MSGLGNSSIKSAKILFEVFAAALLAFTMASCGGGSGSSGNLPPTAPTAAISVNPATITLDQSATVTWSCLNATSATASGSWSGALALSGLQAVTPAATGTQTYTLTCTGAGGTATASATLAVNQRQVTIHLDSPNIPNGIIYSDFGYSGTGGILIVQISCTGCQSGDMLNATSGGQTSSNPYSPGSPWVAGFTIDGHGYFPRTIELFVTGSDNPASNTLWYAFVGSQNMVAQDTSAGDPSSGEIYYNYTGNGTQGSAAILKYKQDGTADGGFAAEGFGIAADSVTHDVLLTQGSGIGVYTPDGNVLDSISVANSSANFLGISAADGLSCATQPGADSAYCFYPTTSVAKPAQAFQLPGIPPGSHPVAIKVLDNQHVALYCSGNQMLYWFTVAGTTTALAGNLQLAVFTATDTTYATSYSWTGGWDLALVNGTLCVMGQVVNPDGSVSQKLALVDNATQTVKMDVDLPAGTIHIAADPTNNAVVAEYPDFSGAAPVTRFERIDVDTGNTLPLQSTSSLVPAAGFLVTQDGSHLATFVLGQADFQPNQ